MDSAIEVQLNAVKSLKMNNAQLEAQLSQLATELQDKEKLVSVSYCLFYFSLVPVYKYRSYFCIVINFGFSFYIIAIEWVYILYNFKLHLGFAIQRSSKPILLFFHYTMSQEKFPPLTLCNFVKSEHICKSFALLESSWNLLRKYLISRTTSYLCCCTTSGNLKVPICCK